MNTDYKRQYLKRFPMVIKVDLLDSANDTEINELFELVMLLISPD